MRRYEDGRPRGAIESDGVKTSNREAMAWN